MSLRYSILINLGSGFTDLLIFPIAVIFYLDASTILEDLWSAGIKSEDFSLHLGSLACLFYSDYKKGIRKT